MSSRSIGNSITGGRTTGEGSSRRTIAVDPGLSIGPGSGAPIDLEKVQSSSNDESKKQPVSGKPPQASTRNKKRSNVSGAWLHFTKINEGSNELPKKAICNYCQTVFVYTSSTCSMLKHTKQCAANPECEKLSSDITITDEGKVIGEGREAVSGPSPFYFKFDQAACRKELIRMFVVGELAFNFVENEAFRWFLKKLQPKFEVISRSTLTRDIFAMYDEEKILLKGFISRNVNRVCLTTYAWTSNQNMSYLSVTAHFVDDDWLLHKKILCFIQINQHTGESMGRVIEECLKQWGIKKVLTVTVDNASANNNVLSYLKKCFMSWDSLSVLKGEQAHLRCSAHILNLVVRDGLKEIDDAIYRIRAIVKYVKSSPTRFGRFMVCAVAKKIQSERIVCMDVDTRWNSTYKMLEAAVDYENAFLQLEGVEDGNFVEELKKGKGVPTETDWKYARNILPFLKAFFYATNLLSGSSYVTANSYIIEVAKLDMLINLRLKDRDEGIRNMSERMKMKFKKYWVDPKKMNMLLMVALVLDPRFKIVGADYIFKGLFEYGVEVVDGDGHRKTMKKLNESLKTIFEHYKTKIMGVQHHVTPTATTGLPSLNNVGVIDINAMFWKASGNISRPDPIAELNKYLKEDREPFDENKPNLDVLSWWKINSYRFLILAAFARDLLSIHVSTVASESAFSTGGRVIDDYRSRLSPRMVQALICTQDWVRGFTPNMLLVEDFEELEKLENEYLKENAHQTLAPAVVSLYSTNEL